jgi:hypothetical protein
MDLISFLNDLAFCAYEIDTGRKGLATHGEERSGHVYYDRGISGALAAFQEAHATADPETLVLAELGFSQQELQFCDKNDADSRSSLTQAIRGFNDALRCLKTVEDAAGYRFAETAFPTAPQYRVRGFPKDAFHIAAIAHRTRLRNVLRAPGINMIEKALLTQRAANMTAAQKGYAAKQEAALA